MTQLDSMLLGLIKLKMERPISLEDKCNWLTKFVNDKYPNDKSKQQELVKYAAKYCAQIHVNIPKDNTTVFAIDNHIIAQFKSN